MIKIYFIKYQSPQFAPKFQKLYNSGIIDGEKFPQIYINNFRANKITNNKSN